jgi:hypothetical protein
MSAQIAEKVLLEPYCPDCKIAADDPTTVRLEAEGWVARHDAEYHPEPEPEDA